MKINVKSFAKLVIAVLLVVFISGCMNISNPFLRNPEEKSAIDEPKSRKTTAVYYNFEDVLIPSELKIVQDKTAVVSTPGITSGIISLRGRVERTSLLNFFSNNMQKDNWNIVSQFISPATTFMVFQKTGKTSVITIRDEQIFTYVEIGVAPTLTQESSVVESSLLE